MSTDPDDILSDFEISEVEWFRADLMRWIISLVYLHGASVGYLIGESAEREKRTSFNLYEVGPRFDRLKFEFYRWQSMTKLRVYGNEHGAPVCINSASHEQAAAMDFVYLFEGNNSAFRGRDEIVLLGQRERYNKGPYVALLADTAYQMIQKLLPDAKWHNRLTNCQSVFCGHRLNICRLLGDQWLCEACIERFSLEEPVEVYQDETPKEKTERSKMTPSLRFDVLLRDKFTCRSCGRSPAEDGIKLHADHIKPIAQGGKTEMDNLQTLCSDCNLGKSAKWTRQIALAFCVPEPASADKSAE